MNEQKYQKALDQAKKELSTCGSMNCDAARLIFRLFPQLAESEDERIRKWLVNYFETISKNWLHDHVMPLNSILTWLEKQKEQKPAEWSEEDEEMINGCIHAIEYELIDNGQDEQVATDPRIAFLKSIRPQPKQEWSEDEIIYWNTIKDYFFGIPLDDKLKSALDWFKSLKPQPKQEWSETSELVLKDICNHLKEKGYGGWVLFLQALRNGEFNFQPKQEWSEEEKEIINHAYCWLDEYGNFLESRNYSKASTIYEIAHKLKSLTPQSKQEWSEEDEACIRNLESIIYYDKKLPNDTRVILGKFLSNLRPQSHWKPSEEQMSYLWSIYRGGEEQEPLRELIQDLKKL